MAAWTHLLFLDLVEFKQDEAEALNNAVRMVETRTVPLTAPASSTGIINSPVITWLLAVPVALGADGAGATGFLAAFTVAAAALTFAVGLRISGPGAGVTAGLIVGCAFWLTIHTRKAWDVGLVPFWVAAVLLTADAWLRRGGAGAAFLFGAGMALLIQFHMSSIPQMATFGLVLGLAIWGRVATVGNLSAALGGFVLALAPVWMYQVQAGFPMFSSAAALAGGEATIDATALMLAARAFSDSGYEVLFGPGGRADLVSLGPGAAVLAALVALATATALAAGLRDLRSRRSQRPALRTVLVAAAMVIVPIVFYTRQTHPLQLHYFLQVVPPGAVLVGWLASIAAARAPLGSPRLAVQVSVAALVVAYVGVQVTLLHQVLARVSTEWTEGGYAVPYRFWRDAFDVVGRLAEDPNRLLIVNGRVDRHQVYGYLARGKAQPVLVDLLEVVPIPAAGPPPLYFTDESAGPVRQELRALAADGPVTAPLPGGRSIEIVRLDPERLPPRGQVARFANGVEVDALQPPAAATAGETVWARVDWSVASQPAGGEHRFTLQAINLTNRAAAQSDGIGWPVARWRTGDRVLSWMPLRLDPEADNGPYRLNLGMYVLGQPGRAPVETALPTDQGALRAGTVDVAAAPALLARLEPAAIIFSNGIRLAATRVDRDESGVTVWLLWTCERAPGDDLNVFTHLVGPSGLVAQHDGIPANGAFPTSLWQPGTMVLDRHRIPLPAAVGGARVLAGLYRASGERIPLAAGGDVATIGVLPAGMAR